MRLLLLGCVLVFLSSAFLSVCLAWLRVVFTGYSKTTEARMCEAYVTLGRLSHVKMRHEEDAEKLRALLDERVGGAFESALEKVRWDVSSFFFLHFYRSVRKFQSSLGTC